MPEEVGVAYVRLRFNTSGMAEEARSEVGGALRGVKETVPVRPTVNRGEAEATIKRDIGGAVKSAVGYIGGIFAAEKVFDFGKEVVSEAAIIQKAQETIRSEYGESGEAVEHFANTTATQLGISAAASETASSKLGALFQNLGFGEQKSARFDLALQKVVGGLSQIRGVDPSDVLDKLNTTMATGSTRGLRQLGVALDATTVKAEAMRLGLVKTTVDQGQLMSAQEKAREAQQNLSDVQDKYGMHSKEFHQATIANVLAHESLKKAIAGTAGPMTVQAKDQAIISLVTKDQSGIMREAAKHQDDAANQAKILSAEWQNMKAAIGEALLPVFTSFVQELVKGVSFLKDNRDIVVNVAEAIGIATAAYAAWRAAVFLGNLVMEVATGLQTIMTSGFTLTKAAQVEATAATEAQTVATEELNTAMYLNPAGLIAVAIIALAVGLFELYQHSATARRIMNELWADIKHYGGEALHFIAHVAIPAVREAIGAFVGWSQREWHRWGGDITEVVKVAVAYVRREINDVIHIVRDVFNLVGDLIHGRWSNVWHDAVQLVKDVVKAMLDRFGTIPERVGHFIERIGGKIISEGGHLVHEALQLGKNLVHGMVQGIENAPGDVANAIKGKADSALHAVAGWAGISSPSRLFAQRIGKPISDGIVLGAQPLHDDLRNQMTDQLTRIQNQYRPVWHDQFHDNVGRPISQGIVQGTSNLQSALGTAIVNAAHGAIAHAQNALGISSPSTLFAEQIGKPLADGIVHGMGGLEAALAKKITAAAQSAMSTASGGFGSASPQGSAAVGYNQRLGYQMMLAAGWPASQWGALQALWTRESGWNANAVNPSSGAAGIPQALGHGHVFNLGDARAQIAWGLEYIRGRYGSPSAAWAHEEAVGWYQGGGVVPGYPGAPQPAVVHGGEVVFTPDQMNMLGRRGIHIGQMIVQTPSAVDLVSELDHIARSL